MADNNADTRCTSQIYNVYHIHNNNYAKNGLHHSGLRAIGRWFMDRSDNGEWCALLTYKIGQKITILPQEAHFLVTQ